MPKAEKNDLTKFNLKEITSQISDEVCKFVSFNIKSQKDKKYAKDARKSSQKIERLMKAYRKQSKFELGA